MERVFEKEGLYYIAEEENFDLKRDESRLIEVRKCPKCNGRGWIGDFMHIENGLCFNCNGSGTITRTIKTFKTLNGAEKHIKLQEKKALDKENKLKADTLQRLENLGITKVYVVSPEINTYLIKDKLFENGCIFRRYFFKEDNKGIEDLKLVELDVKDYIKENITAFYNVYTRKQLLYSLADFVIDNIKPLQDKLVNSDFAEFVDGKKYGFTIKQVLVKKDFDGFYGVSTYYVLLDNESRKIQYTTSRTLQDNDLLGNITATIKAKKDDLLVVTRVKKVV